jgi:hypothetical protein
MTSRGGRRQGSGRPAQPRQVPLIRRSLLLEPELIERACVLGNGNFTAGVRRALVASRLPKTEPETAHGQ